MPLGTAAPGCRDFGRTGYEGVTGGIGHGGYSWSSAVSGTNGVFLYFTMLGFDPSGLNNRGYGFQLRCLSE